MIKTDKDYMQEKLKLYADFSLDETILNQINDLNYLPWLGIDFNKNKTLIVGESFYLWEENVRNQKEIEEEVKDKNFLRKALSSQGLLLVKDKKKHVFYRNIERLFFGVKNISQESRIKFWKSVAFHQFVQSPMKNNKERPTDNQYEKGATLLKEVCDFLEVKHCVFLGSDYSKFKLIKESYKSENFITQKKEAIGNMKGRICIAKSNDKEIIFTFVRHPSAFFSWKKWHKEFIKDTHNEFNY